MSPARLGLLLAAVVAFAASTGCGGNTAHFRTNPPHARVYSVGWLTDGRPYGHGATGLGSAPVTKDGFRRDMTYEFAATDGERILWKRVVGVEDEAEIVLDLETSADTRPLTKDDSQVFGGTIRIGMAMQDVLRSWGPPHRKLSSISQNGKHELWTWDYSNYDSRIGPVRTSTQTAFFTNGVLSSLDTHGGQ